MICQATIPQYNPILLQLLGAGLAIIGGFFAVIIRLRVETKLEITHIKISLIDELTEIISLIDKLQETFRTTHLIPNDYLNDLSENNKSFDYHRQKFFLIKNSNIRKLITTFYKNLTSNIKESINKVNKLGPSPAGNEHDQIITKFDALKSEAKALQDKLEKYKYKIFWII